MPSRPKRPCPHPGCAALVSKGYCEEHTQDATQYDRQYDRQRGTARARGYGKQWEKLRVIVLAEEPLCRECDAVGRTEPATDVDHILPKRQGGTDKRENLQGLCHSCHSKKTGRGE